MPPQLTCEISESVRRALERQARKSAKSISQIVDAALATAFDLSRHSLFQVSTANALVRGVFESTVTVGDLKRHGDFGLGTFAGLDGELVMVDGECYRATAEGALSVADDGWGTPFAVVTNFLADARTDLDQIDSAKSLETALDAARGFDNLFAAFRIEGRFGRLSMRAACRAAPGEGLEEATAHQSEFGASDVAGTLVGFWSPEYARAVAVPGYHFHFISEDRALGGHVLDVAADALEAQVHVESDLHLALPETEEFLRADLSGEHQEALERAETRHRAPGGPRDG